ncbi:RES domain-containing protein [Mycobacterium heidelbergense]|uniref:RES domain-containing protein n=1 Tax=Mycobacterium heidelbergense TaxID=53376 RepID=UPI001301E5D0|nr:RES domain-containing protein [Mycobacterium heidelbergense]
MVVDQEVHRIGYVPEPWNWTPWEHAQGGRFDGRWDDPEGNWRVLYVGDCALACYLEVLAPLRPDPTLAQQLADIATEDENHFPTAKAGELPRTWCEPRRRCSATLSGRFVLPGHHKTLPTLRKRFLQLAKKHGCQDLDAGAIRYASRELTQAISAWIYTCSEPEGELVSGIEYLSRHGDNFTLWSLYERDREHKSPLQITNRTADQSVTPDDPDLVQAMEIHGITWSDD